MKWLKSVVLVFLSTILAASADNDPFRLPNNSVPLHYDLKIKTNVHTGSRAFSGTMLIDVMITGDSTQITLHSRGLGFNWVSLYNHAGDELNFVYYFELDKDFLTIINDYPFRIGQRYRVKIEYSGVLSIGTNGFYRTSYSANNQIRYNQFTDNAILATPIILRNCVFDKVFGCDAF